MYPISKEEVKLTLCADEISFSIENTKDYTETLLEVLN